MKVAVLCLCLISITAAWPVSKLKQHATSASSEEKHDPRGHHSHRHHHHQVNSQSWERLQQPQDDLASPQQALYSSEESVDVPVQLHFPGVSSKSHEDAEDDDDDSDSNDTDESDEVITGFPTDIPVTVPFPPFPFTRGDNAGRGDSVGYRVRAKAAVLKSSKLLKAAKKLLAYGASEEEDESALDAASQQAELSREAPAAQGFLRKHGIGWERADKWQRQDSSELEGKRRDGSSENDSRQKFDSHEVEGDGSKAGARGDSHQSTESRESLPAGLPEDNSNQTLESAEDAGDHRSIDTNEVTL
ncbi:osteopontin [Apus apus]|uniref:osteopontin n=1 Tax=Apus apus TaxID=8895 RepID=UPI0021F8ACC8|nr:osteopontin [Apus apus]